MGNVVTILNREDTYLEKPFLSKQWLGDLKETLELTRRFTRIQASDNECFGFKVNFRVFRKVYEKQSSDAPEEAVQEVFDIYCLEIDETVNMLDVFAGSIMCCEALYDQKVKALFKVFDLKMAKELDKEDMILLVKSCIRGMCLMTNIEVPSRE